MQKDSQDKSGRQVAASAEVGGQRTGMKAWVLSGLVLAALLIGVAVGALLPWRTAGKSGREVPSAVQPDEQPHTAKPKEPHKEPRGSLDRQLIERLHKWRREHPDKYLAAIKKYQGALQCMNDPELKTECETVVRQIEFARKEAASAALTRARAAAVAFAKDGEYDAAIELLGRIPEQFADLIAKEAKAQQAQLSAEAEGKIRVVLSLATRLMKEGKPADGLAALDRQYVIYKAMDRHVQALRERLLAEKKRLDKIEYDKAVAAADKIVKKLVANINAAVVRGDLSAAVRTGKGALKESRLDVLAGAAESLAEVTGLLPAIKAAGPDHSPRSTDETVAAAVLALAAKDAGRMQRALRRLKTHPLLPYYDHELAKLKVELLEQPKNWGAKGTIAVTGGAVDLTDYATKITVPYMEGMRADYSDLRFRDSTGNSLSYWIEQRSKTQAAVWVKIPRISKLGTAIAYYYRGPKEAVDRSSAADTFIFFDDFSAGFDEKKWMRNRTGASRRNGVYVDNGQLHVVGGDGNNPGWVTSKVPLPNALAVESRWQTDIAATAPKGGMGLAPMSAKTPSKGWSVRACLVGVIYDQDTYNRPRDRYPNHQSVHLVPVKAGVKLTPFWNRIWFRQTLCYDGTQPKDNVRYVRNKGDGDETLVHTAPMTKEQLKIHVRPWGWGRVGHRFHVDWIAVRKYASPEPSAEVLQD